MSGFSQFPEPSARYTVANSYDMPLYPALGTMVYQLDLGVVVIWNGSAWTRAGSDLQTQTLYVGKPGTVFIGATVQDRYRPGTDMAAVVTNLTISYPTGGASPLAIVVKPDSAAGVYISYFTDIYPYTIMSLDTYLPMLETDAIGAGMMLNNGSDFDGDTTLTITGIEYPV